MTEPTTKNKRLFVSFSGGETSAFMGYWIINSGFADKYNEVKFIFANTGQENEETLEFINECDEAFNFNTTWVEAVTHHGTRKSNSAKVVDFDSASRNGEPFEEAIKKYGIPNQKFPSCTRDLKTCPMSNYLKSIGWEKGTYDVAIGIRADEKSRRSKYADKNNIIYPFLDISPKTKPDVNEFWSAQKFRLNLLGYQGNCKWCWKKSGRKLMAIMDDDFDNFAFPEKMEELYGLVGPEFNKTGFTPDKDYRRTFFRGNLSVSDLKQMYINGGDIFDRMSDDSLILPNGKQLELDIDNDGGTGCVESCEINFDDF